MQNLLEETISVLAENGKSFSDIEWVGSNGGYIPIELFKKLSDIDYFSGFGGHEIAKDLMVVGGNWWLERAEYDGAEWWEFKSLPEKPVQELELVRLNGESWECLSDMDEDIDY